MPLSLRGGQTVWIHDPLRRIVYDPLEGLIFSAHPGDILDATVGPADSNPPPKSDGVILDRK